MTGRGELRVMVVAHSLVVPSNRARWERLAELHPDTDITVVCPATHTTRRYGAEQRFVVSSEERRNYRVWPIATTGRGFYRSLTLRIRRIRPHVVQVNEEPTQWALLQVFLAARALAPTAARLLYNYTNIPWHPDRWYRKAKTQAVLRLADGACAGSSDAELVLRELGLTRPVYIQTEIGADERVWTPRADTTSLGPFRVGFVGPLVEEKGVQDLARAVVGLECDWRLAIAGDGPERRALESIIRDAGFGDRLDMLGLLPREALPELVRGLDVLVLPSRTMPPQREQFGLVLAEAMLCRVAVVGSDCGAIPEVIGNAGLVFPEGDVDALRAHLQYLADDPKRRADLAERGRERALEKYSATTLARATYDLYRQALSSGRWRGP